jgi:hypothetical protein
MLLYEELDHLRAAQIERAYRGHRVRKDVIASTLNSFAATMERIAVETDTDPLTAWSGHGVVPKAWCRQEQPLPSAAAAPENLEDDCADYTILSDSDTESELADRLAMDNIEQPQDMQKAETRAPAAADTSTAHTESCISRPRPASSPETKPKRAPRHSPPQGHQELYVSVSGSLESLAEAERSQQVQSVLTGSSSHLSREELLGELYWVKAALASRIAHLMRSSSEE